jgi:hypothetical protein
MPVTKSDFVSTSDFVFFSAPETKSDFVSFALDGGVHTSANLEPRSGRRAGPNAFSADPAKSPTR